VQVTEVPPVVRFAGFDTRYSPTGAGAGAFGLLSYVGQPSGAWAFLRPAVGKIIIRNCNGFTMPPWDGLSR
jgi:hypothetical protein